ncbi:MAG: hypothetical protein N2C14_14610 [Planctomycetales bacterium]
MRISGLLLSLLLAATAAAHPISISKSFAYVTPNAVKVRIEVFAEDLYLFHKLKPNARDALDARVMRSAIETHKQFLLERFVIRDAAGQPLTGNAGPVAEIGGEPEATGLPAEIPLPELMTHTLAFELQYSLPSPPEFLTFSQRFSDKTAAIPAEMTLVVKQSNGSDARQTALRSNVPQTFRFDWNRPPLSPDASDRERAAWIANQKLDTLGVADYGAVYSFLYINDFEITHEILIPLMTLEASVKLNRDDDDFLSLDEQAAARETIGDFFAAGNPMEIDGIEVKPTVLRCDFYGVDFKDFARRAPARPVSLARARVGIILSRGVKGSPGEVKLTWNRFNQFVHAVQMIVYPLDAEATRETLSRINDRNVFRWRSPDRPPAPKLNEIDVETPRRPTFWISIPALVLFAVIPVAWLAARKAKAASKTALAGMLLLASLMVWTLSLSEFPSPFSSAPRLSSGQAGAVFASLHKNVYRAFDYRREEDVYDALANSADGEMLRDVYLKIRRGLVNAEQGGAVSRIRKIEILEGDLQPPPESQRDDRGFRYKCRWTVQGTVEHWGHVHARTNEYAAVFTVEPRDGAWKLTGMELLDEQRLASETTLRGL